ncbi:beta-ketoacyl-ACP synthase III [Micromonospora sp. WMMD987]|uniref:beta-ketoacyl-ACP synthase III n=1 Tax=Micromonospora sp. WMMD987 TaxID=3016089 RepID=UPI00249A8D86|nr:beta-ketoacyl-ACP synthase III [Micromonospora sp. WMMD987]WFE96729.1 ketoacyl-ACP synthase III [Micromonospora sp. WMMD987]
MAPTPVITGIGASLPPSVVTNDDLARQLDTTDEWIRTRTGISRRHVVQPGTTTSDLAVEAGARALKNAGTSDADLVVLATTTPDRPCPATAPTVAARLGLGTVPAFDVAAVCSGFVYALYTATAALVAGQARTALVVGAESFTTLLNPRDRTTAAIFGDGAGAVVLSARPDAADPQQAGILHFDLGSDGTLADLITVPGGGAEQRTSAREPEPDAQYFQMDGRAVFSAAVRRMSDSTRAALGASGWSVEQVDWLVGHQANVRILTAVAEQLDLPPEKALIHLDRVGNTSAASIPLALADGCLRGRLKAGDRVVLTAFGGGATWGSATLVWPDLPPVENPTTAP